MRDAPRRTRVLSVAHTGVSRDAGRLRYHPLVGNRAIELRLIVPARWYQFGRWLETDSGEDAGLDVVPLPIRFPRAGPASWYLHLYPSLGRQVRDFAPDVIHLWEEPWSVVALHAALLARRVGAALVLEVDQNIRKRLPPPFEQIRRFVLRRTDLLLARSNAANDVARACGFVGPSLPIGYGVDTRVFHPTTKPARSPLHLGYVGRLVSEKGLDDMLDALALGGISARFTILGEGPHEAALRAHVTSAGLGDQVSFRPWSPPDEVAAFLRDVDVLVLPTRTTSNVREQFGRVIIEAQSCGTPVIGSTSGAIADVVGDGGWIVPERNPAALHALLVQLEASPLSIRVRAAEGRANVAARFTFEIVARDLARAWLEAHAAHLASKGMGAHARKRGALVGAGPP